MKAVRLLIAFLFGSMAVAQTLPVVINQPIQCATSVDGSVVGTQNPVSVPVVTPAFTGTLPAANYYVQFTWYDPTGQTLASPEIRVQLVSMGQLQIAPPVSGMPQTASGMKVYISTVSGSETLQGTTVGNATFTQSTPLATGSAKPSSNGTKCYVAANDAGWPTGTGYNVSLTNPNGSVLPGYPMQWQLLGPGGTVNLNNGLPYYNGQVNYPVPILARPYNHAQQSISGPLSLSGYNLTQVTRLGIGTSVPGWGVDAEETTNNVLSGIINAQGGYLVNGLAGTSGQGLCSDGTYLDAFCNFIPSTTVFYYQTLFANNVAQTQRLGANFTTNFSLFDSASPSRTTIDLSVTGIGAGACAAPLSITFDIYGRASACTPGGGTTPVAKTCTGTVGTSPWSCYRILADGTIEEWGVFTATALNGSYLSDTAFSYPHAFAVLPSLVISGGDYPDASNNDAYTSYHHGDTISGSNVILRCSVNIGGSGCGASGNSIPVHWHAFGQ